jgi:hypothetical protein
VILSLSIPKIRLAASVGIYLSETSIAWCVLEKTFRVKQVEVSEEPCTKQDWAVALQRVLTRVKETLGPTACIVIGLPASHAFFATLPSGAKLDSAENLLASAHLCTSIQPGDLCADVMPVKVQGKTFAAVAASRKKELQTLIDVPGKLGFRFVRVEPGPWALLRSISPNKAGRIALRLLVDGRNMMAELVCGAQPLLWRSMELSESETWEQIVSMVRSFESYATQHLNVTGVDAIILEGSNVKELGERLAGDLGERFSVVEGPGPTPATIANGLAIGGLDWEKPAPDLAAALAPPPELWDLVPRGEVAVLFAVIVCMALWLYSQGSTAVNDAIRAEEINGKNSLLSATGEDTKLKEEKKIAGTQVQAVTTFLNNRILWTEYLNQLSGRIPSGVQFVTFQGEYELTTGAERGERKAKKGLMLNFSAMCPRNKPAPPEVDQLLENVKTAPAIVRDFPNVTLTTLRVNKGNDGRKTVLGDPASFTILCLPKGKDSGPAKPVEKKEGAVAEAK